MKFGARNKTVNVVVYIEVEDWFMHRSQLYVVRSMMTLT
jgi:hypothetical protein